MSASRIVIDAFTRVSDNLPVAIKVRYKDVIRRIYVGFGEIRIPFFASANVDVEELEKEHKCRIKRTGKGWIVTPNVVGEIIERDGVLCSASEEHRKALEAWMKTHGGIVIKTLLGL